MIDYSFLSPKTAESVNCRLLPPVYSALLEHEPPVYLRIVTDPSDMMYQAVESRALDAAIVIHEESARSVEAEPVYRENFVVARIPLEDEEPAEYVKPSELEDGMEFYIEWSGGFRLWHDHIWEPMKTLQVKVDSVKLATLLMRRPGQWCMIPESARAQFALEQPRVVFSRLHETPPDIVYYKLTHKHPKTSSVEALAIFDEVLKRRITELGGKAAVK